MAPTTTPTFVHGKNARCVFVNPNFTSGTFLANTTLNSAQVTALSSTDALTIGQAVTGSGIPSSTVVTAIYGQNITLSNAATATATNVTVTFSSTGVGYDFSPFFNDISTTMAIEPQETTTFLQNGAKTYIPGLKEGTMTLSGFYDGTVGGVDAILNASISSNNDEVAIFWPAGGTTDNERCFMAQVIESKYDLKSPVNGVVATSVDFQADGGVRRGRGQYLTVSASGNSSAYAHAPG